MSVFGENYKEQIKKAEDFIKNSKVEEGVDILDSINFRKIHNISAIVKASELYEKAEKMDEAKAILVMAHERSPIGRIILFNLCLLCLRQGEIEEGNDYYNEFVRIAPNDYKKYVLKYHLAKSKGSDDYTLISILEELKAFELVEEWGYKLAFLYHKTGQIDKCVDLCDEVALYYGEGAFVEKALELKILYRPLTKEQEKQYRKISGIDCITAPNEENDIIDKDIPFPIKEYDNFDTINLQTEIRKNIDEIMNATKSGEVDENLGNIEELTDKFPYLKMDEKKEKNESIKNKIKEEDDALIKHYKNFLYEEYDGQLSLYIPEENKVEEQVEGQLTIDDVLKDWNKTSRAAKAALKESEKEKFEHTKKDALKKANHIMNRLEEVMPRIDAGVKPDELVKEIILSRKDDEKEESSSSYTKENTFSIPKVNEEGDKNGVGLEIPVVSKDEDEKKQLNKKIDNDLKDTKDNKHIKDWNPPKLSMNKPDTSKVSFNDVVAIMSDMNDFLQQEIEKQEERYENTTITNKQKEKEIEKKREEVENVLEKINLTNETATEEEGKVTSTFDMKKDDEALLAETIIKSKEVQTKRIKVKDKGTIRETKENLDKTIVFEPLGNENNVLSTLNELDNAKEDEESTVEDERYTSELTNQEKETFSYFLPIPNMEEKITKALFGAKESLLKNKTSMSGNILIVGGHGSGKTTLSKALIMTLKDRIDKPGNNIGKIDANKLNDKDIQVLYRKIKGGCLVIEMAGDMSKESAISLELMMHSDKEGTLVILEDTKAGINRALSLYPPFAKKFTERIDIPEFSIDELVAFGKRYSSDEGYVIDEIGSLALYDRISKALGLTNNLYFIDIIEIVNEAISRANNKGFFHRKKVDEYGKTILSEKDFL